MRATVDDKVVGKADWISSVIFIAASF
jgi:hypothetical protein